MKKKRTSTASTKRMPPSVPKCVKKDNALDGYVTDFVKYKDTEIKFLFHKTNEGYIVSKITRDGSRWIDMRSESLSPTTRTMFKTQPTLTAAIKTTEMYLGFTLPLIR